MIATHGVATALSSLPELPVRLIALDVELIGLDIKLDELRHVANGKRTRGAS